MSKFDRKAQQLKARVQFIRGTVRKSKGAKLTDAETDTFTDQAIADEIELGTLEAIDREADEEPVDPAANEGGAAGAPVKTGGK